MIKKNIATCILLASTFCYGNIDKQTYLSIAEGVLAKNKIVSENISIIDAKPLAQNNTILQIAYKNTITNDVSIIYAISDNAIIIGGDLLQDGIKNDTFDESILLKRKLNIISPEVLKELSKFAIELTDVANGANEQKENLFIALSPNSKEFNFLFIQDGYKELIKKYKISLIFINADDSLSLRTAQLLKNKLTAKEIKDIVSSGNLDKLSPEKIQILQDIKKILENVKTLNNDEKNGIEPIYFIKEERINPIFLLDTNNTKQQEIK
jgi:hypothetical protein